jgi:hypothetical protein
MKEWAHTNHKVHPRNIESIFKIEATKEMKKYDNGENLTKQVKKFEKKIKLLLDGERI